MGTLQINGYLKSPSIWGIGGSEENDNGINFKSGSLYFYGKTASDARGIYDSLIGSIISVTNSGTHFYGNASSASNSDTVDGYHASSLTKDFYLEHSIFNDLTNNGYGGVTYCGGATDGFLCIGREWGWSNGNNFGMQLEVSGWDGTLRTRSFNGWGTGWTSWKTYIHDGNIGSQSVNYANSAGQASKWVTARTLTLSGDTTGSVSIDGSGNVTLTSSIRETALTDGFQSSFRTSIKGNSSSGPFISVIRSESAISGYTSAYGSGLAFGRHDTHGYIYLNYSSAQVYIGAGSSNKLNWVKQLAFTDSTVAGANYASSAGNADTVDGYHAANFAAVNHTHNYVPTSSGSMSGILTLTKNSWNTTSHYSNAGLYFNAVTNANVSSTYYKPWISGIMFHNGVGYGNTVVMGQFSDSCSSCGFYIGHSWDGNNSDTFYKFYRDGHFHVPRPVTSNYGTSLPSGTHIGEIYFYTG